MAVRQKGAISFGLVYIPVNIYTATQDEDIRFNQLTKDTKERVRYVKTCAGCKKELSPGDIVRGYQYEKDKYVIITDEDLEKIKTEKDRSIQILQFSDVAEIPPVYYEHSFYVQSQKGGEKAFELLRKAMLDAKKVAVGKTVMGTKETMLVLMPTEEGIVMETLFFHEEIRELPKPDARPKVNRQELEIAGQLIESMVKPFEPEQYEDEYQAKLRDLIEKKIAGKEIVAEQSERPQNIINLMEALQQSLKQQSSQGAGGGKKKTG